MFKELTTADYSFTAGQFREAATSDQETESKPIQFHTTLRMSSWGRCYKIRFGQKISEPK